MVYGFFVEQRKELAREFLKDCRTVLDAGCGDGKFLGLFKNMVGVETNSEKLKTVRGKTMICASVENLPFKDGSFDGILCTEVLEHVRNYMKAMNEIHRVAKVNGKVLITTPNKKYEFYKNILSFLRIWPHEYDRWISISELCKICEKKFDVKTQGIIPLNLFGFEKLLSRLLGTNSETLVLMLRKN